MPLSRPHSHSDDDDRGLPQWGRTARRLAHVVGNHHDFILVAGLIGLPLLMAAGGEFGRRGARRESSDP